MVEITDGVAVIVRRCKDRRKPEGIDAKVDEVVETFDQPPKRAAETCVEIVRRSEDRARRRGEAVYEHLIDDGLP